ncbi:MAG: hypothetical protein HQL07_14690 [Nitrospirae bacterium]|nr:hypothetical protein [Magnetococcales bacterium]HAT51581.1 hypothetical protein [Alphaproteobacteria bacterium]
MKKNLSIPLLLLGLLTMLLPGCASGPNPYNDPRQGGLLGGLQGESGGDYDLREQQRRDRLQMLKQQENQLHQENALYESNIHSQEEMLQDLRDQVQTTSDNLADLRKKIQNMEKQKHLKASEKGELAKKLASMRQQINDKTSALQNSDAGSTNPETIQLLEKQLDQLRREYAILRERGESLFVRDPTQ